MACSRTMPCSRTVWFLLFNLLALYAKSSPANNELQNAGPDLDIHKLLSTDEDLWLYKETFYNYTSTTDPREFYYRGCNCERFKKKRIDTADYFYTVIKKGFIRGHDSKDDEYGKFELPETATEKEKFPKSILLYNIRQNSQIEEIPYGRMTFLYSDSENFECNVMLFQHLHEDADINSSLLCQMFVKPGTLAGGPSNKCDTYFNNCKGANTHTYYSEKCKNSK